jgi:hypothetical protein
MSQQQIEDAEVIVVDASTEGEESQQTSTPAGGDKAEEKPDSVLPWQGDPIKPSKPSKEGGKG